MIQRLEIFSFSRFTTVIATGLLVLLGAGETVWGQFFPQSQVVPQSRVQQQRGTALGGLAGAVVGGLIGDNNGEAGAGAAIGGVVGAVTGGILGNAADQEQALLDQRHVAVQQQRIIQATQGSITPADVISLSRSGVSENIIITQIQQRGVASQLQTPDIIALHQQGVSENIIVAMQQAHLATARRNVAPVATRPTSTHQPVIIHSRVVVPQRHPHYYHRKPNYYYRSRPGFHIRF